MSNSVNIDTFTNARFLNRVQDLLTRSTTRLSSGSRIVSASDDPAGAALGEKLTGQNKRIQAASTNIQNAISHLQTVDGFLTGMNGLVTRMSELQVMANDPIKNPGDIALYQSEFTQLQDQLRVTIGGSTAEIGGTFGITKPLGTFNGNILFGSNPGGTAIATGDTPSENIPLPEINLRNGGMLALIQQDASGNYTLHLTDSDAGTKIMAGIQDLGDERSTIGAVNQRFDVAGTTLIQRGQDLTQSLSDINDVSVATESTHLAKYQMLAQAATSMLTQENRAPQAILKLLS